VLKQGRRPVASLCIALLALNVVDCYHITQQETRTVIPADGSVSRTNRIRGVTLTDGRQIQFDKNRTALVLRDTLRAVVQGQSTVIAVSDVRRVWLKKLDKKTTLVVVGAVVVGVVAGFILVVRSADPEDFTVLTMPARLAAVGDPNARHWNPY
jgi:hypothetical protein